MLERGPRANVDRMTGSKGETMAYTASPDKNFYSQTSETYDRPSGSQTNADFVEHLRTYRGFVKGMMLAAGHLLAILVLLYLFLM
jgi:hypothetical protein